MPRNLASFSVGSLTVHHLNDGSDRVPRESWFRGTEPETWTQRLGLDGPDHLFGRVLGGCFLITGDGDVTLVDTGYGAKARERESLTGGGELLERLAELEVSPTDVTRVFQTHLHVDHSGWLLTDDASRELTFPNASVHMHESELAYWSSDISSGAFGASQTRARIEPVREAGKLHLFSTETKLSSTQTAIPTPGHTPGHSCLLVTSQEQSLIILGDLAHHPVHLEQHNWLPEIDVDPDESIRSRAKVAKLAAELNAHVVAPHMPMLTLGRVWRDGDHFQYVPDRTPDGWSRYRKWDE